MTPAATTFAIVMHDDQNTANARWDAGEWVHWISYNMVPGGTEADVPRDASQSNALLGGTEAFNSWFQQGYNGPCPPDAAAHDYYFTVYALDTTIIGPVFDAASLFAAMEGHILDRGDLHVTFAQAAIGTTRAEVEVSTGLGTSSEGSGTAALPSLLVNGVVASPATATLALNTTGCAGATATYGADYTHSGGSATITVAIPPGTYDGRAATAVPIPGSLSIVDDLLAEASECLTLELVSVTGGAVIGDAGHSDASLPGSAHPGTAFTAASLVIDDNDVAAIEFAAATASGAEAAGGQLPLLLVAGVLSAPIDVTVSVTGGTATSAADFSAPTTVTIPAGTYDGTAATGVVIPGFAIADDTAVEGDETILFGLTSADAAVLAVGDANGDAETASALTFTIADDEATPTIEFAAGTGSAAEAAGGALPRLLVNGTLSAPVEVTVFVTGGTAAAGADFAGPTTVTIPAGVYDGTDATSIAVPGFTVTDDSLEESDETAVFSVTTADAAILAVGDADGNGVTVSAVTFTILDDDTAPAPSPVPSAPGVTGSGPAGSLAATGVQVGSAVLVGIGLLAVGGLAALHRTRRDRG